MLETIRDYALKQLHRAGDLEAVRRRHAEHYTAFAERASQQLHGPAQLASTHRLETEHDNLRAALAWSFEPPAGAEERTAVGLRLVEALIPFWYQHGHATEGRRWLERALDLAAESAGPPSAKMAHRVRRSPATAG